MKLRKPGSVNGESGRRIGIPDDDGDPGRSGEPAQDPLFQGLPRPLLAGALLLLAAGLVAGLWFEARSSFFQARLLAGYAEEIGWSVEEGPSPRIRFPGPGPFDQRRGHSRIPHMVERLEERGFRVDSQAAVSPRFAAVVDFGLFPVYPVKDRAGFRLLESGGEEMYATTFPERTFPAFDSVPDLLVSSLLFIENRELLALRYPYRNPAVDWGRFARSLADLGLNRLGFSRQVAGGSTLATQIEKYRHSPEGRTDRPVEKLRQMASASLRAYLDGPETTDERKATVLTYLNTVPLSARPGYGEVIGLGDGLWVWYGAELEEVARQLSVREGAPRPSGGRARTARDAASTVRPESGRKPAIRDTADLHERGRAYRQALSLFLAQRRPSWYLARPEGRQSLRRLTDVYLNLLRADSVISSELHGSALSAELSFRPTAPEPAPAPFMKRKAANAVRTQLLEHLGVERLYELDRYDLTVRSTVHGPTQAAVSRTLAELRDPSAVRRLGLDAPRYLGRGDPANVVYSFVLYERTPDGFRLRVNADNYPGPFDVNRAGRLELGSTAKLRTLVSYLNVVEDLYRELSGLTRQELDAYARDRLDPDPGPDPITAWAVDFFRARSEPTLRAILEAAVERRYSGSPGERFFTGGGVHTFRNFDATYNSSVLTVTEGFRHSVNLVFVRLMRDVIRYHVGRVPGSLGAALEHAPDSVRMQWLSRFADREGRTFIRRFYTRYRGQDRAGVLEALLGGRQLAPQRLAWAYRSAVPDASLSEFRDVLARYAPNSAVSGEDAERMYGRAEVEPHSLQDLGYLARLHPLELWVARYLLEHPDADLDQVADASVDERQEVYRWLFNSRRRGAQNQRIRTMLEEEAFLEIQREWRRLGYPFPNVVPSFGSSIGSSGDRPAALAELTGILLSGGVRLPSFRVAELRFAEGTPFETIVRRKEPERERVLSEEVASVAAGAMRDVVERGTARQVAGLFRGPEQTSLPVGGKTGTGNNRFKVFGPGGRLTESRPLNRTATFVFFAGDRWFGTVTAFVEGAEADGYGFTSSLPVRLLGLLAPELEGLTATAHPLLARGNPGR